MTKLFTIFICSLLFAYLTERTTVGVYGDGRRQPAGNRFLYTMLLITMILPAGLRAYYNDTGAYIRNFTESTGLAGLLTSGELHILQNPAFSLYTALVRSFTDNYTVFFMLAAIFVQASFVHTIRLYVRPFTAGIGLFFCLGTYVFSLAAMKQTIAMAILMLAIPRLLRKQYIQYFLIVFAAFLFHTYAIAFIILPLFHVKPWKWRTYVLLVGIFIIMGNFEPIIGSFLDYANESGKSIAEYEVFDNAQVNILRVMVYAVVPVMSLLFRKYLFNDKNEKPYWLFVNMSIISCSIMLLGTISGANMFARMAMYFEIGIVCSLAWMVKKIFAADTRQMVFSVAAVCFLIFFIYANAVALRFDDSYGTVSLREFIVSLF